MAKKSKTSKKGNALQAWVKFIKLVQKEEGLSYKEAMMRAKERSDKGEKWKGGDADTSTSVASVEKKPVESVEPAVEEKKVDETSVSTTEEKKADEHAETPAEEKKVDKPTTATEVSTAKISAPSAGGARKKRSSTSKKGMLCKGKGKRSTRRSRKLCKK